MIVLFSMNLLNYVDRYVFYAVGEEISKDLGFDDLQFGYLSSSFMVVYTAVSPVVGYLGDRWSRKRLLAFGVGLWSFATVGTAFAGLLTGRNFSEMFFWRALLGVGEASYGILAPTLLADLFQPRTRARVVGLFYLALPMGGAIGYALGGIIGHQFGWRSAFLIVGFPGLIASISALFIRDPGRGASEGEADARTDRSGVIDYLDCFRNRTFVFNTAGLAAVTFTTGVYAVYGAKFFQRVHGLGLHQAGIRISITTLAAGLLGILLGIWLPDFLRKFTPSAYLLWAALACMLSAPLGMLGLLARDTNVALILLFGAIVLLASVLGPCNAVTADVVPARRRAAGYALSIFLLHLFGDIASPPLIGWVSIRFGSEPLVRSRMGRWLAENGHGAIQAADGTLTNLTVGMLMLVPMLALGGLFFWIGSRSLPSDLVGTKVPGNKPIH
ncbi:MAG: MFS transporter [Isosphaeraceae bacterium]